MTTIYNKPGNGFFSAVIFDDGTVETSIYENSKHKFQNVKEAYDYHRQRYDDLGLHSHWNVCYHLMDHL